MRSSGEIHGAGASSNRSSHTILMRSSGTILMRSSRTIPMGASGVIANGATGVLSEKGPPPPASGNGPEKSRGIGPEKYEKEQPPDYSHAPPATPREDATVKIVVMGDANADWLAFGLEDAFSEKPEIGIVRKHRTDSGLIRYDQRRDSEWPQVAREIVTAEKPKFVVMMIGNNDRQTIREKAPPPAPANAQPTQPPPPVPPSRPDLERQPVEQQHPHLTPAQARQADYGPWEFQSEKWELAYIKRIDATIAAVKPMPSSSPC